MLVWDFITELFTDGIEPIKSRLIHHWNQPKVLVHWDDMVFEGREKNYGSYLLRKHQPWYMFTSLGLVGGVFLYVVFLPVWLLPETKQLKRSTTIYCLAGPVLQNLPRPPHNKDQRSGEHQKFRLIDYQIPQPVTKDEIVFKGIGKDRINQLKDTIAITGDPSVIVDTLLPHSKNILLPPPVDPFQWLDEMEDVIPDCVCGPQEAALYESVVQQEPFPFNMDDVRKLIGYPRLARDAGISGRFVVRLLVNKQGRYTKHRVIRRIHPILDQEVEKHLDKLRFTPAIKDGKPVSFWVNIPFRFHTMN